MTILPERQIYTRKLQKASSVKQVIREHLSSAKTNLKNLKQFYKDVKNGHERSGYNRDNWPYFELIDAILGDRPATRPPVVVDTTIQAVSDGSPEQRSTSSTPRHRCRNQGGTRGMCPPLEIKSSEVPPFD